MLSFVQVERVFLSNKGGLLGQEGTEKGDGDAMPVSKININNI